MPDPLFTFVAHLGVVISPWPHGLAGATLGTRGVNAAVVSVLGVAVQSMDTIVQSLRDFGIAHVGLSCLSLGAPRARGRPQRRRGDGDAGLWVTLCAIRPDQLVLDPVGQEL